VILQCDITEAGDAAEMAWRVAAAINEPIPLACGPQSVGASIGIVLWDKTVSDIDELLRRADQALYECKRSGKNQFRLWSEAATG
jgi:GGDEF domain-containing protein